jgi:predicted dehydrogenase
MQTLGLAVTGCGYMGSLEARVAGELPGFRPVALHSRTLEKTQALAEELDCAAYATWEEALDQPEVDAAVVATPNDLHLEPVLAAVARGKHVFLEKPMALTVADCRRMQAAADEAEVRLFLGHPQRFMDGVAHLRQALHSGRIGLPVALRSERNFWLDTRHDAPAWKTSRARSGGHLFHHMHELDTARHLLGEATEVWAQAANLAHPDAGEDAEDDVVQVSLRFRSGALAAMEWGSAFRVRSHLIRVHGVEGAVELNFQAGRLVYFDASGQEAEHLPVYEDPECQESAEQVYAALLRGRVHGSDRWGAPLFLRRLVEQELLCFRRVVTTGEIPEELRDLVNGEAGLRSVELAQAACLAAETREVLRVPLALT